MPQKIIPQLAEISTVDGEALFPIDTGTQSYKLKAKNAAKAFRDLVSVWNSTQTYAAGDRVTHSGDTWYAVLGSNTNKNPDDEPLYWMPYRGPGSFNPQMPPSRVMKGLAEWDEGGSPSIVPGVDGVYIPQLQKVFCASKGGYTDNANMLAITQDGGFSWTYEDGPSTSNPTDWTSLDYAPAFGTVVVVGLKALSSDPDAEFQVVRYIDGIGATGVANPISNNIWSVKFIPDLMRYVLCGGAASSDGVAYSDDGGATWTQGTAPEGTWGRLVWADHLQEVIMLSFSASGPEGDRLAISSDGIDFDLHLIPNQNYSPRGLCYSKSLKLIVATINNTDDTSKCAMISRNGRDWFLVTMPESVAYNRCAWSEEMGCFVAVNADGGTYRAAYSFNGITWLPAPLGTAGSWYAVVFSPPHSKVVTMGSIAGALSAYSRPVGPVITL